MSSNMDLYTALSPAHFFWKYTGIATFSLKKKPKPARYVVHKFDNVLVCAAMMFVVALNIANVCCGVRFDDVASISDMIKRSSYNIATLLYVLTMYYHRENVIRSIERLSLASSGVERETKVHSCHYKMRKQILKTMAIFMLVVVKSFIIDVFYEGTEGLNCPALYFMYYYTYYILTVSAWTMLFFFLTEIKRILTVVNNYLKIDIYDNEESEMNAKLIEMEKLHRLLRSTSKTVNNIFQLVILGKVSVTSMFVLVAVFRFISNKITPIKYYKELYTTWCLIHLMEVGVAVKLFVDVQTEVTFLHRVAFLITN